LVIYLHGFASSPHSGKARYLGERLQQQGIQFLAPDLSLPDFSALTVTRMVEQTGALIEKATEPAFAKAAAGRPGVTLIGSSLGAFVAVNAAVKWPDRIARLILMAPALDFGDDGLKGPGGADIAAWKAAGQLMVFHFAYGRMLPVHYELYEDARRYDAIGADLKMPILVFQGRRDTAVDPATVEAWSRRRPNVELHMLDDDHQLTASLSYIWAKLAAFLDLEIL
jgi:pimeloyl-ACP methyl ester carboxylesterase